MPVFPVCKEAEPENKIQGKLPAFARSACEYAAEYFDLKDSSPYMLLVKPVNQSRRRPLPDAYEAIL